MTTIPPVPPSASAPSAPTAPSGQPTAVLTQLPGAQTPTPGTVITGTVVGRDNHGQTLLQTDAGVVAFKTAATLTVGSQVSLQIQAVGSQLQAVVLSALAAGTKPLGTTPSGRPLPAGGAAAAPATTIAPSVSTGAVLTATVIGPSGGPVPTTTPGAPPGAPAASPGGTTTAAPTTGGPAGAAPPAPITGPAAGATLASPTPTPAGTPASPSPATPTAAAATAATLVAQQASTSPAGVSAAVARYAAAPGGSAAASPSPPATTMSLPTTASTPNTTATGTPATPPPLHQASVGTTIQIRLANPSLPTPQGMPAPAGSTPVAATLVAHMPNGQTLIDTPLGRLTANLPANVSHLPLGSSIALDIVSVGGGASAATPLSLAAGAAKSLPTLGHDWPTLKAAIGALNTIDPAFARQLLDIVLPRLGTPRFLSQLLGQLTTGGGPPDARTLLGDTAHALLERAGRGDLLARLDAELRESNRLNSSPSDWRVIFLPIADMGELRQLRVYTRKKKGEKGKEKEGSGRFIVEADFEAYGPMQLDGLVQKPRIDLIVRSHVEFPPGMQAGIAEVFGRTCDSSGLIGKIFFHASAVFPVSPLDDIAKASPGLSV